MLRTGSILSAVAAGGLLVWGSYTAVFPTTNQQSQLAAYDVGSGSHGPHKHDVMVEDAEQDLGERPLGGNRVIFHITNRSGRSAEFVGLTEGCQGGCCFHLCGPGRVSVQSNSTVEIGCELEVPGTGPFKFLGEMYLNDSGQLRTVRLRVTGVGVSGGKPNANPP